MKMIRSSRRLADLQQSFAPQPQQQTQFIFILQELQLRSRDSIDSQQLLQSGQMRRGEAQTLELKKLSVRTTPLDNQD